MIFSTWPDVARVTAVGGCAYVILVVFLRMSGKRTLTKLNAFDLVVTVALPRLMVYHATVDPGTPQADTFKVMERRLLRAIVTSAPHSPLFF